MVLTAFPIFSDSSSIIAVISSVNLLDSSASFLISWATTEKPLPASPALAASMAALRASRLVCSAMFLIIPLALFIFSALLLVFEIIWYISFAASLLELVLMTRSSMISSPSSFNPFILSAAAFKLLTSCLFLSIRLPNSSMLMAPLSVSFAWSLAPFAISSIALATSSAAVEDCWLVAVNSSEDEATCCDTSDICLIKSIRFLCMAARELPIAPISSFLLKYFNALLFSSNFRS
ncbi:hypothetical protein SDC9_95721 [bioreactor metagenome]|uniref:Uncharacterized protein n=1 Tax=bioreactor metagenome TaxID=1076179 RepID=A0A645AH61_9ZZZZ